MCTACVCNSQALSLEQDMLDQREVVHVDIAFDEFSSGETPPEQVSELINSTALLYIGMSMFCLRTALYFSRLRLAEAR